MEVSVHQRLVNLTHTKGTDPNLVRLHYVMVGFGRACLISSLE